MSKLKLYRPRAGSSFTLAWLSLQICLRNVAVLTGSGDSGHRPQDELVGQVWSHVDFSERSRASFTVGSKRRRV